MAPLESAIDMHENPDAKASYHTPATYQPRSTEPRPTVHTKTGQPPKYGHSPPAQLSPAKPTTKSTKSKNMQNSTSFVFHTRPANKIYFSETFDLYHLIVRKWMEMFKIENNF